MGTLEIIITNITTIKILMGSPKINYIIKIRKIKIEMKN
jgi:hypothetical protein